MNRTSLLILLSVLAFVAVNTVFYFVILNQQLEFQTDLISQQTRVAGNTIEREGSMFENELHSVPYQNDFTKLFTDEEVKQQGSIHLQQLYTGYSQLINKITVYDNQANVYSLILDYQDNFVSDYYESQRQTALNERDELIQRDGKFLLTIPGFDDAGRVRSNIVVDLNFKRFVNSIFERYALEQTLWQTLLSSEGKVLSSSAKQMGIPEADLNRIHANLSEDREGFIVHRVTIDSIPAQVVSVYYPVRLVKRDFGIVFSMKTDLFLRSIMVKIILISVSSLILIVLLLYIHFRVIKSGSRQYSEGKFFESSLKTSIDKLPVGLLFITSGGGIRLMNRTALQILGINEEYENLSYDELGLEESSTFMEESDYQRTFGEGSLLLLRRESDQKHIFKTEWEVDLGEAGSRLVMLVDVSLFERSRNLDKITSLSRIELLESMGQELSFPLQQLGNAISELSNPKSGKEISAVAEELQKSFSLLSNLINATMDFACHKAGSEVTEEIPFSLRSEVDLALDQFRVNNTGISVITKIRTDVPDELVGDPFRFRQVILNLVRNAEALTEEGRILISAEILEHRAGTLKLHFHVEDTGRGLPAEEIEQIMKDLDTGSLQANNHKDEYRRRLSSAKQHIELMKGQLRLASPSSISTSPDLPGISCSFTMEVYSGMSVSENLVYKNIRKPEEVECLVLSQEKIEDGSILGPLTDLGINPRQLIYRSENLVSACELVSEKSSSLHLVIIIHSSSEDGFHLAAELKQKECVKNQVLILASSLHKQENHGISRNTGIEYYLEEPFSPYRLLQILKNHFPEIDQEDYKKLPVPETINQNLEVLLAEDNIFNRKVIQGLFKRLGCEIDQAKNGREAVDMAGKKKYDIIFMDLLMPEMDGIQAVSEIRKSGSAIPIIALTAVEDKETLNKALKAGFNNYLIKPASEESLRNIILQSRSASTG